MVRIATLFVLGLGACGRSAEEICMLDETGQPQCSTAYCQNGTMLCAIDQVMVCQDGWWVESDDCTATGQHCVSRDSVAYCQYESLYSELDQAGAVMVSAYRVSGSYYSLAADAWLVSRVDIDMVGETFGTFLTSIYVDEAGSSAFADGDLYCSRTGEILIAAVDGFDPVDRVVAHAIEITDDCEATLDVVQEIHEVESRDTDGVPRIVALWRDVAGQRDAPFPGWRYSGGIASPTVACFEPGYVSGRNYCRPTCDLSTGDVATGTCPP